MEAIDGRLVHQPPFADLEQNVLYSSSRWLVPAMATHSDIMDCRTMEALEAHEHLIAMGTLLNQTKVRIHGIRASNRLLQS